jgi:hypothetical protein
MVSRVVLSPTYYIAIVRVHGVHRPLLDRLLVGKLDDISIRLG